MDQPQNDAGESLGEVIPIRSTLAASDKPRQTMPAEDGFITAEYARHLVDDSFDYTDIDKAA